MAGSFPRALMDRTAVFCAMFLISKLPTGLESPSSGHLLYQGLFPCVSYWCGGTRAVG